MAAYGNGDGEGISPADDFEAQCDDIISVHDLHIAIDEQYLTWEHDSVGPYEKSFERKDNTEFVTSLLMLNTFEDDENWFE